MSSRALKRLERQKLEKLEKLQESKAVEDASESEDESLPVKPKVNVFALLNDDDNDNDEESQDEEESRLESSVPKESVVEPSSTASKKSKSKKKKNKKKKAVEIVDSDEELDRILADAKKKDQQKLKTSKESSVIAELPDNYEDVYDFEEEFDMEPTPIADYDSNFKYFTSGRVKESLPLLAIESTKNLDPDQEFRNLLGNLSLDTIEDANTTTSLAISPELLQQFKKLARLTRGWGGGDRRGVPGTTRKLLFTKIRDDYLPTAQKPMGMEEISQDELIKYLDYKEDHAEIDDLQVKIKKEAALGVRYFRFTKVNNVQERVANTRFYASVVMTPDPESLIQLQQQYPYHAETLLQVAMVLLRQGDNKSTSNALIEKALFVFDRSVHKRFHELLSEGKTGLIRLPYEGFLNRQFHLCLFRYIIALGERSAFFTALNYCKFLLSISPAEDPLGVRYFLDHYAIMSEEFKYLTKLAKSPLVTTYNGWLTPGIAFSTVLAYLHLGDEENARNSLKLAYTRHPYVAFKLLESIGLSATSVSEQDIPTDESIILAAETYVVRAPLIWNDQAKRQFLHDELHKLFESSPVKNTQQKGLKSIFELIGFKADSPKSDLPFNLIRFAILSGENKIMAKIPQVVWSREDTFEYDLLPPKNTTVDYNEYTGVIHKKDGIVDSLIDYVDQNLLGQIVQNRTAETDFDGILRQLQEEEARGEE
ncbi:transcriptional repressor TCF25-domain-containing protein [Scheffersomyces xylosifermentans]|uniref:transcriptional repressor TCF25-domain-containing protein n=1 Tax=Scheffersomyces xylosifermentans TaxID=1304137 RepID=UPI00315CF0F6